MSLYLRIRHIILTLIIILYILIPPVFGAEKYPYKFEEVYNKKRIAHFKNVVMHYNSSIDDKTAERISKAIIYYSYLHKLEDDRVIAAIIAVESTFKPQAVSRSGAQGLGQLMPGTARGMKIYNSFDIENNIWGTVKYLKKQLVRFGNQPRQRRYELALAAYNAGPGAVRRYGGIPPFQQTQNYVVKVINVWRQLCGLSKFSSSEVRALKKNLYDWKKKNQTKVKIIRHN